MRFLDDRDEAGASRPPQPLSDLRDYPYRGSWLERRRIGLPWRAHRGHLLRRAWSRLRRIDIPQLLRRANAWFRRVDVGELRSRLLDRLFVLHRADARILHVAIGRRWDRAARATALYAQYAPSGAVSDMVRLQLDEYARLGFNIIVITPTTPLGSEGWEALRDRAALVVRRRNLGFDFGAWGDAMPLLLQHFPNTEEALLLNDSVLGPLRPLGPVVAALRGAGQGLFGLTDSMQIRPHLQSYVLLARGGAAINDLAGFLFRMPIALRKRRAIRRGEIALSVFMRQRGHRVAALYSYERTELALMANQAERQALRAVLPRRYRPLEGPGAELGFHRQLLGIRLNPTHHFAAVLVRDFDFPFVKTELVVRNHHRIPEALRWRQWVNADSPCSVAMMEAHLADLVRRPRRAPSALPLPPLDARAIRRPPTDDRSLALPLGYAPRTMLPDRIGVLLHLFHPELATEMRGYVCRLPGEVDLHVTTDTPAKQAAIAQAFAGWTQGVVAIRLVPNRGRDVAARLVGQRDLIARYPLMLCLHGKRSAGPPQTAGWRRFLLEHLLGSPAVVAGALEAFTRAPDLGVLAPQHLPWLRPLTGWGVNFAAAHGIARRMGIALQPADPVDFPSGSMFWARGAALRPLLDLDLQFSDFPEEAGQRDGTLAHALERLPLLACEAAGFRWAKIAIPRLHEERATIVQVGSASALDAFLRNPSRRLLAGPVPPPRPAAPPAPDPAGIVFAAAPDPPDITVIIPCYGRVEWTLRCLAAIAAAPPRASLEIIVAEDASGDHTVDRLAAVRGITLRRNPENLGFVRNCNTAAANARGRYLLFLNNDTEPHPCAVDAMLELAEARPDAGLVGARLIYPDGRLQEAGGIVWNDASAWNFGRWDEPSRPEYGYVREVDYCSGAAILVRRTLFTELGGFDEAFAPAYYEDTDLAFRLRARGLKALYQPRAVVMHHEGVSHGTASTGGGKLHQERNRAVMFTRWQAVLAAQHQPPGRSLLRARDRAAGRKIVLVADHKVPEPDRDAGSRCCLQLLQTLLADGRAVKFLPDNGAIAGAYGEALQQMGIEVLHGDAGNPGLEWIARHGAEVDQVLLQRPAVAERLLPALRRAGHARIAYFGHDLHAARMRAEAAHKGDATLLAQAAIMESLERRICREVDVALYPSFEEVSELRRLEPGSDLRVLQLYGIEQVVVRGSPPAGADVLFVAGFSHPPNEDAAGWLAEAVLPLILAARPDARLLLVGSYPSAAVQALARPGLVVSGAVSDAELAAHYARARVVIVPLRFGGGVKGKVVEALAAGVPLVTTPTGAQGLPELAEFVPVRSTASGLAEAAVVLLTDDSAWRAQSAAQAIYAKHEFAPERMRSALLGALDGLPG